MNVDVEIVDVEIVDGHSELDIITTLGLDLDLDLD